MVNWCSVENEYRTGERAMGNVDRKATSDEMSHATQVIREAFPELEPASGGIVPTAGIGHLAITRYPSACETAWDSII